MLIATIGPPSRPDAARERLDAATLAEQVMDDVLVELVVGQDVVALIELELSGVDERRATSRRGRTSSSCS